ncbi:protein FAM241B-like [Hydractinia symbiolongicarpus]|uniref:protein FAM241B-like n=1 Tax=Hydractinia symbiolongicarpus TaxID=13093 RepID=UPI00254EE82A|nr:protein FAM241B-like [Hydractinia symbiolongicarpus]
MVKIIGGEVVQDDDPRAIEWERRQNRTAQGGLGRPTDTVHNFAQGVRQDPNQPPLVAINNRLRGFGIPDFNVGGHVIEPLFSVAGVLALVFWGLPGLLIVAVVWYVMTRQQ